VYILNSIDRFLIRSLLHNSDSAIIDAHQLLRQFPTRIDVDFFLLSSSYSVEQKINQKPQVRQKVHLLKHGIVVHLGNDRFRNLVQSHSRVLGHGTQQQVVRQDRTGLGERKKN
jgi:hypothetical protein